MPEPIPTAYLAAIGAKGGRKSRRSLSPEAARAMAKRSHAARKKAKLALVKSVKATIRAVKRKSAFADKLQALGMSEKEAARAAELPDYI